MGQITSTALEVAKARLRDAEAAQRRANSTVEMRRVEVAELERQAQASLYPEDPGFHYFRVSVQPTSGSPVYEYALVNVGGRFFTTGRREHNYFASWQRLVDWLRGCYWHSDLIELDDARQVTIS